MPRKPKALHWEPRAGASDTQGGALGFVVLAFQADWQMCTTMSTTYN